MAPHVNWFNVMSYDIHGTWDGNSKWTETVVQPHTNLTGKLPSALQRNRRTGDQANPNVFKRSILPWIFSGAPESGRNRLSLALLSMGGLLHLRIHRAPALCALSRAAQNLAPVHRNRVSCPMQKSEMCLIGLA